MESIIFICPEHSTEILDNGDKQCHEAVFNKLQAGMRPAPTQRTAEIYLTAQLIDDYLKPAYKL